MERSLLGYVLIAAIIGSLFGAVVTYAFLLPRIHQIDSSISELETTLTENGDRISNLDDRLSMIEENLSISFSMQVFPEHIEDSIPGQRCVFLVVVADEGLGSVSISATAFNASVTVDPQAITPGQVAEVTVIPNEASIGETLVVNVRGERGGLEQTETITVRVVEGEDGLWSYAAEVRDAFILWLAANHPEFGITSETEWTGTIVYPGLYIYSYYLFFSEDWEMGVRWHVTTVPNDWAEIYLRRRFVEVQPSYAFKIDSFKTEPQLEPHAIDPPESVYR